MWFARKTIYSPCKTCIVYNQSKVLHPTRVTLHWSVICVTCLSFCQRCFENWNDVFNIYGSQLLQLKIVYSVQMLNQTYLIFSVHNMLKNTGDASNLGQLFRCILSNLVFKWKQGTKLFKPRFFFDRIFTTFQTWKQGHSQPQSQTCSAYTCSCKMVYYIIHVKYLHQFILSYLCYLFKQITERLVKTVHLVLV